jgi:outer membrane lipoprotein-sorting protein
MQRAAAALIALSLARTPAAAQEAPPPAPPEPASTVSVAVADPAVTEFAPVPPPRPGTRAAVLTHLGLTADDTALIDAISAYHSSISTMVGKFEQIDQYGGRLEGVFYLERPDKVRFRYAPPSTEEIISTGRGFYVIDRRERTRSVYPQEQVPLRQFLKQHIDLLNTNITGVTRTDEMLALSLADQTPIGEVEVTLIFELATNDLRQWSLTEPDGTQLTFSIYDTIKDIAIPRRYFSIDPNLTDANPNN